MNEVIDTESPLVYCTGLNVNDRELIREALDTLLQMTYSNSTILVVDNGSQDGALERVHRDFPSIEIIENGSNLGFAGGNRARGS